MCVELKQALFFICACSKCTHSLTQPRLNPCTPISKTVFFFVRIQNQSEIFYNLITKKLTILAESSNLGISITTVDNDAVYSYRLVYRRLPITLFYVG